MRKRFSRHDPPELKPEVAAHRPIAEIRRDIAQAPAQALPPLLAELEAALAAEKES